MMAETSGGEFFLKLFTLQKRLKGERLFIRQDKDIIRSLNDSVLDTCKKVYHLAWRTRQHWRNLDRLVSGARVFPSECSQTSILIENVLFEDASKHLGYQDAKYGEFLSSLRSNPKLVSLILNCATKHGVDINGLARLFLCCLYGSCLLKEDEKNVLSVLKHLIDIQIFKTEDVFQYFCSPKSSQNAFTLVLRQYSEMLFSSKLYLTAALHGAVMQIIVDDSVHLDTEMSHVLNRLPPRVIRHKFGDPGTPKANRKMTEYIDFLQNCLINLCNKFLKGLRDKIYCFPTSLRWILKELRDVILFKTNFDEQKTKGLLGHVLMNYFICPAIVNPEPFGINSDAFVSETARYNLAQVAGILRSMALAELGMKDLKMQRLLEAFEPNVILSFVDAVLYNADKLDPLNEKESVEGLHANAALMTEKELKILVHFVKRAESENDPDLKNNGISTLLELLPPIPRRWTKQKPSQQRSATSLPIAMQLKANPELMLPVPSPRSKNNSKKPASMYSPRTDNIQPTFEATKEDENEEEPQSEREEYENILKDLQDLIVENEVVLVISFGADEEMPGMLPEEKVLGIRETAMQSAAVDSNDIEEERQRRASSMIQGAMKDLVGLNFHATISEDMSGKEDASSSIENTPKSTTDAGFASEDFNRVINLDDKQIGNNANITSDVSLIASPATNYQEPKKQDLLIAFDETESKARTSGLPINANGAQQQQNSSLLDLSPTKVDDAFNFSPNNSNSFLQNKSATLGPGRGNSQPLTPPFAKTASLGRNLEPIPSETRTNQVSTGSLLGGLNTILQQPSRTLSDSFPFKNDDPFFPEESAEDDLKNSVDDDVMHFDQKSSDSSEEPKEEAPSEFLGREQPEQKALDSKATDAVLEAEHIGRTDKSNEAKQSIDSPTSKRTAKGIISCVMDTKSETLKQMKKEMAEQEKRDRKKSSSAWLIGKLATGKEKIKSVKNRTKSDGQALRREQQMKAERKMTEPQSQLRIKLESESHQDTSQPTPAKSSEDISEEILQKYRGISTKPAGLMEDDQSSEDVIVQQNIEFDDDFKFEDAKRKLRIVLCMADRSNFPSEATSCFQLFMTFLQAQLAEAINLQDRSVVAQLHETLRSIKQLPQGSCEKLLDALQEDYEKRAPYITYLLRSKQGLLASMSHLEQICKKVERDKTICSKYFTTVCVRLFLETPEKRKEIICFSQKFEEIGMVDEKCALLEEFLENIYKEMSSDPTWVSALNEQWDDAKIATERTVMSKIYKFAFYPNGPQDIENDKIFHEHINSLSRVITVNHKALQIPKVLQKEAPWPSAQTELLMINAYKTPADKLRCIHRCCIAIMNLLSMATPNQTSGADEFVPVLVYVLIRANPPNLLSTKQYINNFSDNRIGGEEMYCWTQFSAAVEFVKSLKS